MKSRLRSHTNRNFIVSLCEVSFTGGQRDFFQVPAPAADFAHLVLIPLARGDFLSILLSPTEPLGNVAPSEEMAKWMELYKKALAQLGGARMGSIQNLLQAMLQGVP